MVETMKTKQISNYIRALTARTQLGQILKRVRQHNERFVVGRRGEAQAVIMSVGDYLRNFAAQAPALKKVQRRAETMARADSRLKQSRRRLNDIAASAA